MPAAAAADDDRDDVSNGGAVWYTARDRQSVHIAVSRFTSQVILQSIN